MLRFSGISQTENLQKGNLDSSSASTWETNTTFQCLQQRLNLEFHFCIAFLEAMKNSCHQKTKVIAFCLVVYERLWKEYYCRRLLPVTWSRKGNITLNDFCSKEKRCYSPPWQCLCTHCKRNPKRKNRSLGWKVLLRSAYQSDLVHTYFYEFGSIE